MSESMTDVTKIHSDDIDILLLLERCLHFFKRYKWIFIIAFIAGIGLGLLRFSTSPKIYSSRMVIHSFMLSNQEYTEIIDNWNNLVKKQEYTTLAEIFNCPESLLHKLKKIEGNEIQKIFSSTNPSGVYIDVNVTDNSILPELQKSILYGMNNGDYVKSRLIFKKQRLTEMIAELKSEISKFDSTKTEMEKIIQGKERPSSSVIVEGSNLNHQWIDMNEKLLYLEEDLNFSDAVQVLQGFSAFTKPTGPNLIVLIVLGLILCLSIAYVIALFHSISASLKARARSRK